MSNNAERLMNISAGIVNLVSACGVTHVFLSPGSRSAPLALSFIRNKNIKYYVISDERSAAYMALGMAKQLRQTVALVCTSGTAALNYAPALAEANNQHIPLLVFTADRPAEVIGQGENQTINQNNMYEPNIRASYTLNITCEDSETEEEACRIINEAVDRCKYPLPGPVHINVPMKEPLYDFENTHHNTKEVKKIEFVRSQNELGANDYRRLAEELVKFNKIMILAGMNQRQAKLRNILNKLLNMTDMVFIGDVTSNLNDIERGIGQSGIVFERMLENKMDSLKPDLLLTFGSYLISKETKSFLRQSEGMEHWHINPYGDVKDTFNKLTKVISVSPTDFFKAILKNVSLFRHKTFMSYYNSWKKAEESVKSILTEKIKTDSEYSAVQTIIEKIPSNSVLHFGNSLPVRIVNDLSLRLSKSCRSIEVMSNRGTSGIDGCLSTAVGAALTDQRIHTVLIGDQSFVYDRNALWNKYVGDNLKIIVLNNKGGGIFRRLKGSSSQAELEDYFVNYVAVDIKKIAESHQISCFQCHDSHQLPSLLTKLFKQDCKTAILEISL